MKYESCSHEQTFQASKYFETFRKRMVDDIR